MPLHSVGNLVDLNFINLGTTMPTIIQLLKSRTVVFAILLATLSVAQGYVGLLPLTQIQQMYAGIAISVIVTVLRIVTTQPISEK
jgi:fatty acid desaturase